MAKVLIVYHSRSGNTEKMAEAVKEGVAGVEGVEVEVKKVEETTPEDLLEADGIIMGSPVYVTSVPAEMKASEYCGSVMVTSKKLSEKTQVGSSLCP